jgi:hypothetical protein
MSEYELDRITSDEDDILDKHTLIKVVLDSKDFMLVSDKNIKSFMEYTKEVFTNIKIPEEYDENFIKDVQGISNLLTIQFCMELNNYLELDVSSEIEFIVQYIIKCLTKKEEDGKCRVETLGELILSAENEFMRVVEPIMEKWKKEDDEIAKSQFKKMMGENTI